MGKKGGEEGGGEGSEEVEFVACERAVPHKRRSDLRMVTKKKGCEVAMANWVGVGGGKKRREGEDVGTGKGGTRCL